MGTIAPNVTNATNPNLYYLMFRQSPFLDVRQGLVIFSGWKIDGRLDFDTALLIGASLIIGFLRHYLSYVRWRMEWRGATNVVPPAKKVTRLSGLFAVALWIVQSVLGCLVILLANTLHLIPFVSIIVGYVLAYWLSASACFGMSAGSCPGGEVLGWA